MWAEYPHSATVFRGKHDVSFGYREWTAGAMEEKTPFVEIVPT